MASRNPAWISHARVRETSAGESGMALLSGSSACSIRSRKAGFTSSGCCRPPSARKRAPSTELGLATAAPNENTASTTVRKTTIASNGSSIFKTCFLNLNPDDPADHKISNRLQRDAGHHQGVPDGIVKQRLHKIRTENQQDAHHDRRHRHQKSHGQPPLRSIDTHL